VLQDDTLSGGKGTFVVSDEASYKRACQALDSFNKGEQVVISDYIEGAHERSVQCVATRYGVFVGPLQKQIIADPLLSNVQVAEGDKFCGAEIGFEDSLAHVYPEVRRYAEQIGAEMQRLGYKGIFSVDCIVSPAGQLYVLEVNPRITGITPLLTMLYRPGEDIPFYLLHVLEMMNADYTITDTSYNPEPAAGSLLVLHGQATTRTLIADTLSSGLYEPQTRVFLSPDVRLPSSGKALLVQQYTAKGAHVKPGGRVLTAYTNTPVLDSNDTLLQEAQDQIKGLLAAVRLELA
jgi:biotin carboxylase